MRGSELIDILSAINGVTSWKISSANKIKWYFARTHARTHTDSVYMSCQWVTVAMMLTMGVQGLSKRFERFKFGIFYVLIVKIRYNFTHK